MKKKLYLGRRGYKTDKFNVRGELLNRLTDYERVKNKLDEAMARLRSYEKTLVIALRKMADALWDNLCAAMRDVEERG